MAGIYIHIPFCKRACHYCNFHFSTGTQMIAPMSDAIIKEIKLRKDYLSEPIQTIYFGGGTPSILPQGDLERMLSAIHQYFAVAADAEITMEANPDDITNERLTNWKNAGVNRLSIGIQSFFEEDLVWMNRAHNATQALECITMAQACGITNITIDLIYGTPTLTDEKWQANVARAIELGVPHLSCYALTVEPKTALETMIAQHKLEDVDPEKQGRHFELLMQWLSDAGYEHYEISNFAKPGFRSQHNSSYWTGAHYLGIGPSAHSFNGGSRQWNIANNALYLQSLEKDEVPAEIEDLTPVQQLNEYIMTSLRTREGLSLDKVLVHWGKDIATSLDSLVGVYVTEGKMVRENNHLVLTPSGKLFADGIASDLFL